jgi:lipopolysaccharide export LptBFGC system permease protein LptF
MKNPLIRAIVFIIVAVICFTASTVSRSVLTEGQSSFLFGFSFPLFVFGLIALYQYFKKKKA